MIASEKGKVEIEPHYEPQPYSMWVMFFEKLLCLTRFMDWRYLTFQESRLEDVKCALSGVK
jgi:hypothetical protein